MRSWPALEIGPVDADTRDLVQAALLDFGVRAIDDVSAEQALVFFHDGHDRDRAAAALRAAFAGIGLRPIDVPDDDWAARAQASLRAIRIEDIVVAPPWDVPERPAQGTDARERPLVIIIQPSMGFGTGHHATTRLCLTALQRMTCRGLRVVDVGTGSGVLAIAASRLGAAAVTAIDDDADAVTAARESLALNPSARVDLRTIDVRAAALPPCDIVIANLTGGLLVAAASHLRSLASRSGRFVLSGLMEHEEHQVRHAFEPLRVFWRGQEDEWVCLGLGSEPSELAPDRQ